MIYKRIFIFGCSFTKHQWPTWADVIRYNADIPVENWGHGGIGNVGILHKLFECDLKNRFTQEDLILIQWSGWSREDRFRESWIANGNVFTSYDKNFIKNHWHRNNDVIKNSTALMMASRLFNIGYQCHLIPLGTTECYTNMPNQNNEIYDFYMNQLDTEDDIFPLAFNSQFDNRCMDTHPDIKNHIHFYENYVRKKLNFLPEIKNKNELLDLHDTISKSINKTMSFQKTMEIVTAITEQFDKTLVEKPLGF